MLKQLSRVSVSADGRFATAAELQFLKDYFKTVESRVAVYEKIKNAEEEIVDRVETKMRQLNPKIFTKGTQDVSALYRRDTRIVLRGAATATLFDDLDRLRDGLLLWHRTIIKAIGVENITQLTHQVLPEVMKEFLNTEELALIMAALQLNYSVLTY
jgi:Phycobilisome protein